MRMMPANAQPMPIPTAAPVDTPAEDFGGMPEREATEVVVLSVDADDPMMEVLVTVKPEVVMLSVDVDDPMMEVLVAVKPEVIVKYGTRADGAGASKVSSVGESQLGVPLESVPQQCHKLLVEFQTTSGRAWSTMQK